MSPKIGGFTGVGSWLSDFSPDAGILSPEEGFLGPDAGCLWLMEGKRLMAVSADGGGSLVGLAEVGKEFSLSRAVEAPLPPPPYGGSSLIFKFSSLWIFCFKISISSLA